MTDSKELQQKIRSQLSHIQNEQVEDDFIAYEVPKDNGRIDYKLEYAGGKWHSVMNKRNKEDTIINEDGIISDSKIEGLQALLDLISQYE